MPPTMCSYLKCNKTSKDFSMFRFPTGHAGRLADWLRNCGNTTLTHLTNQELRNRYLCITHFADKFIQNKTGKRKRITKLAVPHNHNDEQSSDMTLPSTQCHDNSPCPSSSQVADKVILHSFPNPNTEPNRFKLWVNAIGGDLSLRKDRFIYDAYKVCHVHFDKKDHTWSKRLSPNAVPRLNLRGGDCRKKWQCLRDAYRRAINKKKRKGKQEAKNMKPWRYESEMAFVAPFIIERKNKDAVGATSGDEQSDNGEEKDATELNSSEKPNTDIEVEDTAAEISDANSTISDEVPKNKPPQIDTKLPNARDERSNQKKRKLDQSEPAQIRDLSSEKSLRAVLLSKLLDEQNKLDPPRGNDELDRFFLSISDMVKKFPPYVQALTKNKIFSLVSEVELQQLAPSSSTFNPSPHTSTSAMPAPTCPANQNEQIQQFFQKFNTLQNK